MTMTSFPSNPTPFYDFNLVGIQLQNLQRQMTEHSRIVAQQQQAIMQLLQQQQTNNTVEWPSMRTQRIPQLMNMDTNGARVSSQFRTGSSNPRRRTPRDTTLGDFIPVSVRKGRGIKNKKQVRFAGDRPGQKEKQKEQNEKLQRTRKRDIQRDTTVGRKGSVKQTNAATTDMTRSFNITQSNRFLPLAIGSSNDDLVDEIDSHQRQSNINLDTDVPIITKVIGPLPGNGNAKRKTKSKANRKNSTLQITLTSGQPRTVTEKPQEANSIIVPKFQQRPYLQPDKIKEWLSSNVQAVQHDQVMSASQGATEHIDRFIGFAVKTAYLFDQLARAIFDVQVWLFYVELGTKEHQPYWAKEVIRTAKTRDIARARQICENKIVKLNAKIKCLTDEIKVISAQCSLSNDSEEYEGVMFNYMSESLIHVRKQNELKMKMAKIERAENVAWESFMTTATASQKTLALMIKAQLMKVRGKSIRYETAAIHATPHINMLPKAVPSLELRFRFDENSMPEEDARDIFKGMKDITREYRLKATELYIRTAKVELEYHNTRLRQLMDGSYLAPSPAPSESESEAVKAFGIFFKVHQHHTAAIAETSVLRLKERYQRVDAPDPTAPPATTTAATATAIPHIPVQELLSQTGQIQEALRLNKN